MFRRNQREAFSYIHEETEIRGDLMARGRLRIHGRVFGNIDVIGVLEVAESGYVEGDLIQAEEVKVLGHIRANIHAVGNIEIWKTGHLEGDVIASSLDIEQGATFSGRSEMRVITPAALEDQKRLEISEDF